MRPLFSVNRLVALLAVQGPLECLESGGKPCRSLHWQLGQRCHPRRRKRPRMTRARRTVYIDNHPRGRRSPISNPARVNRPRIRPVALRAQWHRSRALVALDVAERANPCAARGRDLGAMQLLRTLAPMISMRCGRGRVLKIPGHGSPFPVARFWPLGRERSRAFATLGAIAVSMGMQRNTPRCRHRAKRLRGRSSDMCQACSIHPRSAQPAIACATRPACAQMRRTRTPPRRAPSTETPL